MDFSAFDLVLYDIDGTLVDTGGAGMEAISQAAEIYFGAPSPALDLAGSTDLGLVSYLLTHYGHAHETMDVGGFFTIYHDLLRRNLASGSYAGHILPGVENSLAQWTHAGAAIGLLTGNTSHGAAIKMAHYQLEKHFPFGAYGDDYADRNLLGPVALERATLFHGRAFSPQRTLVIGDTPKDIACAQAMGACCLAVATGHFTVEQLRSYGADYVVATLSDC